MMFYMLYFGFVHFEVIFFDDVGLCKLSFFRFGKPTTPTAAVFLKLMNSR